MHLRRIATVAACAAVGLLAGASTASAYTVTPSFVLGLAFGIADPNGTPPGVNRADCKLTASKPRPVILVNGTTENRLMNWSGLGPALANAGFCVFAPNYGYYNGLPATNYIEQNAAELAAYVETIRAKYPGKKVDLVGHSQGGMMPRYYIKNLGGAAKVSRLVALAPSNHGTTLQGLGNLMKPLGLTGVVTAVGPAFAQQVTGSPFLTALNAGDETPGSVQYHNFVTNGDQVVTPYTSGYLTGAYQNWYAQSGCILEASEHLQFSYSARVHTKVMNALDGYRRSLPCNLVLPYV